MKRMFVIFAALVMLAAQPVGAQQAKWECDELSDYQVMLFEAIPEDADALQTVMEADDIMLVRPSVMLQASEEIDEWAEELEDFRPRDIPFGAREYHDALIDNLSMMSIALIYMANGNMFGLIALTDTMDEVTEAMEDAQTLGAQRCGSDWPFGDGLPEDETSSF